MFTIDSVFLLAVVVLAFIAGIMFGVALGWRVAIWRIMTENADQFATVSDTIQDQ